MVNPDEVAAVQNERFMNVCDGTSENQWSKTPKSPVARHDLRVLLKGGLAAHLRHERTDVVGDKAIHGGLRTGCRHVPRRRHGLAHLPLVVLVKGVEHLGVGMEVLLARIGVGSVEVLGLAVDHPAAAVRRLVLCPLGDGVREVLADDALEGLAVLGPVEMAEHVVQRTVLKQHQDDMVHGVGLGVLGHGNPFSGVKGRGVRRPSEVHCLWLWPATLTICQDIP
jgi:hypothetical protein